METRPRAAAAYAACAFVLLACLAYARALPLGFLSDDASLVRKVIDDGLYATWGGFFRPLVVLTFRIDSLLYGTWAPGFHLTNVLLHGLCGALVAHVFGRVFSAFSLPHAREAALATACAFVVSPSHTEAVTWIAGRGDVLATLCGLVSLALMLDHGASYAKRALALFALACALASKELAALVPVLLVVIVCAVRRAEGRALARSEKVTFVLAFLLLGGYVALRAHVLGTLVGGYGQGHHVFAPSPRLLHALCKYAVRAIIPPTYLLEGTLARAVLVLLVGAYVALFLAAKRRFRGARDRGLLLLLCACFLVGVAPTLSIGLNYGTTEGERFLYLPSMFMLAVPFALVARLADTKAARALVLATLLTYLTALDGVNARWSYASRETARITAALTARDLRDAVLLNVPDNHEGAYMLRMGLGDLLAFEGANGADALAVLTTHDRADGRRPYVLRVSRHAARLALPDTDRIRDQRAPARRSRGGIEVAFAELPAHVRTLLVYTGGPEPIRAIAVPPRQ